MKTNLIGSKIIFLDRVDSTNNYAAKLVKQGDFKHGTVILSAIQTQGKGQRGNNWESLPYENLTFSIILEGDKIPYNSIISINQWICLVTYSFLTKYLKNLFIKWPNDILVDTDKIAGILIENIFQGKNLKASIVGIGINVNQIDFSFKKTTSLFKETNKQFKVNELIYDFINTFNQFLEKKHSYDYVLETYNNNLWLNHQKSMFINQNNQVFEGKILEVDSNGNLIMEKENEILKFTHGEIKFCERL